VQLLTTSAEVLKNKRTIMHCSPEHLALDCYSS